MLPHVLPIRWQEAYLCVYSDGQVTSAKGKGARSFEPMVSAMVKNQPHLLATRHDVTPIGVVGLGGGSDDTGATAGDAGAECVV